MLDYLKTVESLTSIRDAIRARLDDENRDRQSTAEFAEASLTQLLGELVTPDPQLCLSCMDNDTETKAVAWTDGGEGVCDAHLIVTLLAGTGVRTSLDVINRMSDRLSRLGLASFI